MIWYNGEWKGAGEGGGHEKLEKLQELEKDRRAWYQLVKDLCLNGR